MSDARQIPLSFALPSPKYARQDFIVGEANKGALAMANRWMKSSEERLAICGAEGAGKTHLAQIILNEFNAAYLQLTGSDITGAPGEILPDGIQCLLIDDVHLVVDGAALLLSLIHI